MLLEEIEEPPVAQPPDVRQQRPHGQVLGSVVVVAAALLPEPVAGTYTGRLHRITSAFRPRTSPAPPARARPCNRSRTGTPPDGTMRPPRRRPDSPGCPRPAGTDPSRPDALRPAA